MDLKYAPVNGGLVLIYCTSILDLKPTHEPPVPLSTNIFFQELLFQNSLEFNLGECIATVLKVYLSVVRIHF